VACGSDAEYCKWKCLPNYHLEDGKCVPNVKNKKCNEQ
jgi:hypothetical protein